AEVKEIELLYPSRALRFGVDAAKHVGVALGVEHDDSFTAPNVLCHQQLQKPRLAGAGSTNDNHMSSRLRQWQITITFAGLDTVERRVAPDLRHRRHRVPPRRVTSQCRGPCQT